MVETLNRRFERIILYDMRDCPKWQKTVIWDKDRGPQAYMGNHIAYKTINPTSWSGFILLISYSDHVQFFPSQPA